MSWFAVLVPIILLIDYAKILWAVEYKDGFFWIRGCSEEFLARMRDEDYDDELDM
jgi:hypothetical protein